MTPPSRRSAAAATLAGNGATVAITVVQAVLLIPLCLARLDSAVYSAWLAASELLIWVQMFDGGLPNLLMQRTGALVGRSDWDAAARWTSTVLAALFGVGLLLLVLAGTLAPLVARGLGVPGPHQDTFIACFRVGALSSVLLMWSNGCVGLARGVQRTALVNATQVAGAAGGLVVAVALLTAGWGLWALPAGLLVRALVAAGGGVAFVMRLPAAQSSWWVSPSRAVTHELTGLVPTMSAGNIGYVLANNSEVLLVSTLLGPTPALVYALTRRAFDGMRNLLDTIAWAVSGGFAHLIVAADRHRARAVLAEILSLRLAAASLAVGIVVAVNAVFVRLLFGPEHYGGPWLTMAFAAQVVLGGQSFLLNYLWRSAGPVRDGSIALGLEAVVRVLAMGLGVLLFGVLGAPVMATLVSLAAIVILGRRLDRLLPDGDPMPARRRAVLVPALVLLLAAVSAFLPLPPSWSTLTITTTAFVAGGGLLLWFSLPASLTREILHRWRSQ